MAISKPTSFSSPRNDAALRVRLRNLKVLVADRNRRTALLVKRVLAVLGFYDIDIAVSGEEALAYLAKGIYDMIITEWDMSPIDGLTLVKAIRTAQADARIRRDIPIVMLTARADENSVCVARDAGITEFVAKPFSAHTISQRMIQIIDNPRAFVDSPRFVGPDRRRRGRAIDEGEDRRTTTPTPPAMQPNLSLKEQLGGVAAADIITDVVVALAQMELANAEGEFIDWARDDIMVLRQAFATLSASPDDQRSKLQMMEAAYAIKSQAGIFGYTLGTEVAALLLRYVGDTSNFTADSLLVISKHIEAVEIIFKDRIKQNGQGVEKEMLPSLQKLIDKKG